LYFRSEVFTIHIQILNLNASYDHTGICYKSIAGQTVVRVDEVVALASGKGVDVARTLHALGFTNYTVSNVVGGKIGRLIEEELQREGLNCWNYHIANESRVNYALVDAERDCTLMINEKGPLMSDAEKRQYLAELSDWLRPEQVLVIAGSATQGFTSEDLADIVAMGNEKGMLVAVDTSGPFLSGILDRPIDLLKINHHEFKQHYGRKYDYTFDEPSHFVSVIEAEGLSHAVITMGRRGALAYRDGQILAAESMRVVSNYAIGSGDAFLAGYLLGMINDESLEECLLRGMACGMANTLSYGPGRVTRYDVEESKQYVAIKPYERVQKEWARVVDK
jgi:1-phosphofructokinase family hexose kinase